MARAVVSHASSARPAHLPVPPALDANGLSNHIAPAQPPKIPPQL